MKPIKLLLLAALLAAFVAACAGDYKAPLPEPTELPFTVTFTYPADGAREFPVTGSLIVHFNESLQSDPAPGIVTLSRVNANETLSEMAVDLAVNDGNLVVTPRQPLEPMRSYRLIVSTDVRAANGDAPVIPEEGYAISFETLAENPLQGVPLDVSTVLPDPENEPAYDFQTFRVYFTEPVDRRTVRNKETFILTDADGLPIEGAIFVRATQVVFDPTEDLDPGEYTLTLTRGILDAGGEKLVEQKTYTFDVLSTQPRATLTVENCPTLGDASSCEPAATADGLARHPLTGDYDNSMLVDSILLGPTRTFVSGQLTTEMGNTAADPKLVPLVIRKGQRLYATNIDSTLGGAIPTGLSTGGVQIHVLTDAIGYLHATDLSALKGSGPVALSITLDAAITTDANDANMLMAQNILGTRLDGFAKVDPKSQRLVMEVAGYAEFFIFGERIRTTMSLVMQDPEITFPPEIDDRPPELRTTSPLPGATRVGQGNVAYLLFDEPVDSQSAAESLRLLGPAGDDVTIDILANGPKALLVPREPLLPRSTYTIRIDPGLSDINGNATTAVIERSFKTGSIEYTNEPPFIGTTSPGAALETPVVPGHLPVEVWFSQVMDPDSIIPGDTFRLIDLNTGRDVPGTLVYFFHRVAFYPNEPFEAGHTIRLALTEDITNYAGIGLDLDRDHLPGAANGASEWDLDFIAAERNGWVPLRLMLDPIADTDGSGYIEDGETIPAGDENFFKIKFPLIPEPSYASGYMVSYVKGLDYDSAGVPFLDIELLSGITMSATSTGIDLSVLWDFIRNLFPEVDFGKRDGFLDPMGRILIELIEPGLAPAVESPHHLTQMNISMLTWLTVDNQYYNDSLQHDLAMTATGDLTFTPDGLMEVRIAGTTKMVLNLVIPLVNITIPIPLPAEVDLRAVSRNPLSWWDTF